MEQFDSIVLIDDNGLEIEYEVVLKYYSEMTSSNYIIYTDNFVDDTGCVNYYASIFNDDDDEILPIETKDEWEMAEKMIASIT